MPPAPCCIAMLPAVLQNLPVSCLLVLIYGPRVTALCGVLSLAGRRVPAEDPQGRAGHGSVLCQGKRVTHQLSTAPGTRLRCSLSWGCRKTPGVHGVRRPLGSQGKCFIWNSPKSLAHPEVSSICKAPWDLQPLAIAGTRSRI